MRSFWLCIVLLVSVAAQAGCLSGGLGSGRLARMLPPPGNADQATDGSSDPWIQHAAAEGRREHTVEKVNDPLKLRRFMMSDRAREIEANFGIVE